MPTLRIVRPGRIPTTFFLVVVLFYSLPSWSQQVWPLSLGNLDAIPEPTADCNPVDPPVPNPYLGENTTVAVPPAATCASVTVTGCFNSDGQPLPPVTALIALAKPSGANVGTIVIFNGGSGTSWFKAGLNNYSYLQKYVDNNFQVIQVIWKWAPPPPRPGVTKSQQSTPHCEEPEVRRLPPGHPSPPYLRGLVGS